jgi:hypothetical protein
MIDENNFPMTYPAWMTKGQLDSRTDFISRLYCRPRMTLLDRLKPEIKENKEKSP